MVAVRSALWSDDVKVVSLWRSFHLSFDVLFILRRESRYMWGEWLLLSVGGPSVWDSHEGRVRLEADSAIVARVCNMGVARRNGNFLVIYRDSVRCESERVILGLGNVFYLERRRGGLRPGGQKRRGGRRDVFWTVTLTAGCRGGVEDLLITLSFCY